MYFHHHHRLPAWLFVVAALTASMLLIGLTASQKNSIEHDEGITFLAAAGTQMLYAEAKEVDSGYVGEWVDVSKWRNLVDQPRPFSFGTIRHDLAHDDIHPPAYFWLLHIWSLVFGLSPMSSIALGMVIAVATGITLYLLAMRVFGDYLRASSVVVFWALATSVVDVSIIARQYGLLALMSVLLALVAHIINEKSRPGLREGALFALIAAFGIATHYHFVLILAGILLWVTTASAMFRKLRPIVVVGISAGVGFLMFWSMHPEFLVSFDRLEQALVQTFDAAALPLRAARTITSLALFFVPPSLLEWAFLEVTSLIWRVRAVVAVGIVVCAALLAAFWQPRVVGRRTESVVPPTRFIDGPQPTSRRAEVAMLFLGAWIAGAIVYLYLVGESPAHAMGPRYLAAAWPFLAFLPATLLRRTDSRVAIAVVIAWAFIAFVPSHATRLTEPPSIATMQETVRGADRIVVDSVERGVLPRIIIDTDPGVRIFAANQSTLLDRTADWVDSLEPGDVVASSAIYAVDPANKQVIESLLLERYTVETLDGPKPFTWWRITGGTQ